MRIIIFFILSFISNIIITFNITPIIKNELVIKAKLCKICYCKNQTFNIKRNKMLSIYDNYTYIRDINNKSFCYIFYNKNNIDICFKGTSNINDIYTNLDICPSSSLLFNNSNIKIHKGFLHKYLSIKSSMLKIINDNDNDNRKQRKIISFSGHSSGGAIATIAALDFSINNKKRIVKCYTFGAPIIGNKYFIEELNRNINNSYRIINDFDIIPYLNLYENNYELNRNKKDKEIKLRNNKRTPLIIIIKNLYEYLKITHGISKYIKNLV